MPSIDRVACIRTLCLSLFSASSSLQPSSMLKLIRFCTLPSKLKAVVDFSPSAEHENSHLVFPTFLWDSLWRKLKTTRIRLTRWRLTPDVTSDAKNLCMTAEQPSLAIWVVLKHMTQVTLTCVTSLDDCFFQNFFQFESSVVASDQAACTSGICCTHNLRRPISARKQRVHASENPHHARRRMFTFMKLT